MTTSELRHYDLNGNLIGSYDILGGAASDGSRPLEVARDGTVWVGTTSGIRVFRPNGSTEDITVANSPLADADVRAIQIDPATGAVWIATVAESIVTTRATCRRHRRACRSLRSGSIQPGADQQRRAAE